MKVSIIIPVYNVSSYVERCLLSVLNQSYSDIEIILVDDCSEDDSMQVAKNVLNNNFKGDNVIIVTHERNRGLSAARNSGIDASSGEYIYFLDSDDEIIKSCIQELVDSMGNEFLDFSIGNYLLVGADPTKYPTLSVASKLEGKSILKSYLKYEWYVMAVNKLIRKDFLLKNNLYFQEGLIHEDELWSFKLACFATSMTICITPTYIYHIRENSITEKPFVNRLPHLLVVVDEIVSFIKNNDLIYDYLVYNFLERNKFQMFLTAVRNKLSCGDLYELYIYNRKQNYNLNLKFSGGWKEKIINVHYLFSKKKGFYFNVILCRFLLFK